ncbi:MAG: 3-methyl-2-oxobutanoate hydroxymethyltransferase, partial [Dehalococcoidia bacterium]
QVVHDMLGLYEDFKPKHARRFLEGAELIREAIATYREQVERGEFPTAKESFYMDDRALALIERMTPGAADDMSEAEQVLAEWDANDDAAEQIGVDSASSDPREGR